MCQAFVFSLFKVICPIIMQQLSRAAHNSLQLLHLLRDGGLVQDAGKQKVVLGESLHWLGQEVF